MDAPQDMIKPVPTSQAGKAAPKGVVDGTSDADGAGFAEAMRAAKDASRPETREAGAADAATQTPPADDGTEPVHASVSKEGLEAMLPPAAAPVDAAAMQMMPAVAIVPATPPAGSAGGTATAEAIPATGPAPVAIQLPSGRASDPTGVTPPAGSDPRPAGRPAPVTADAARIADETAPADTLAPASVAVAVDRAIGNAIVSQPSTGSFRAADTPATAAPDATTIASQGFVAAALQAAPMAALGGNATAAPTRIDDPLPAADPEDTQTSALTAPIDSGWLAMRPDSLALTLADRAIARDPSAQVPPQIGATLQQLDRQLAALSGLPADGSATSAAGGDDKVFGMALATAAGQTAQAPTTLNTSSPDAPVRLSVHAPVEQPTRWAAEFGDRLAWVASNRFSAATLQMNPPQLGPIEVRILLNGDQANVSFAAVQPQTREAIQQALPALATSFAAQGLSLGQTSVGRENLQQGGGGNGNGAGNGGPAGTLVAEGAGVDALTGGGGVTRGGQGLVDTFA